MSRPLIAERRIAQMALPCVLHSRCSDCGGDPEFPCETCGSYGHLTLSACEIDGYFYAWIHEIEQLAEFHTADDVRDYWPATTWAFTGALLDRRILDALSIENGTAQDYDGAADRHQRHLVLNGGAWMALPSWQDAVAKAKAGAA